MELLVVTPGLGWLALFMLIPSFILALPWWDRRDTQNYCLLSGQSAQPAFLLLVNTNHMQTCSESQSCDTTICKWAVQAAHRTVTFMSRHAA